jgi:hypothetical protein
VSTLLRILPSYLHGHSALSRASSRHPAGKGGHGRATRIPDTVLAVYWDDRAIRFSRAVSSRRAGPRVLVVRTRLARADQAAASIEGHVPQAADRFASTRTRRAATARDIRSAGTASPVPKYISSGGVTTTRAGKCRMSMGTARLFLQRWRLDNKTDGQRGEGRGPHQWPLWLASSDGARASGGHVPKMSDEAHAQRLGWLQNGVPLVISRPPADAARRRDARPNVRAPGRGLRPASSGVGARGGSMGRAHGTCANCRPRIAAACETQCAAQATLSGSQLVTGVP